MKKLITIIFCLISIPAAGKLPQHESSNQSSYLESLVFEEPGDDNENPAKKRQAVSCQFLFHAISDDRQNKETLGIYHHGTIESDNVGQWLSNVQESLITPYIPTAPDNAVQVEVFPSLTRLYTTFASESMQGIISVRVKFTSDSQSITEKTYRGFAKGNADTRKSKSLAFQLLNQSAYDLAPQILNSLADVCDQVNH